MQATQNNSENNKWKEKMEHVRCECAMETQERRDGERKERRDGESSFETREDHKGEMEKGSDG